MKTFFKRRMMVLIGVWLSLILSSAIALGQEGRLPLTHFDKLANGALESVDVSFNQTLLESMAEYRAKEASDPVRFRALLKGLQHVTVKGFRFGQAGQYSMTDVDKAREQLVRDGWKRIVSVQNRRGSDNGEMYFRYLNGGLAGITTISAQPQELMIVHIVGVVPIEDISMKEGARGLSRLDASWNAWIEKRSNRDSWKD